jgi:hypothetical protein
MPLLFALFHHQDAAMEPDSPDEFYGRPVAGLEPDTDFF